MKESVPEEAFSGVCNLASNILEADEWTALCDRVGI